MSLSQQLHTNMKPSTSKSDGKKRKKEAEVGEPESPKRSKVHAQRKFAQGAGVVSPTVSPIKERDKSRSAPRIVTPPAEPVLQSRVPKTIDFLTFLCFQRTHLLPPNLNYLRETSLASSVPSSTSNTPQQTSKLPTKKAEKGDDGKKQPAGVQALRKKYKEQRIAKQKATNVTTLAKKVKGKNMARSTRSTAVVEEVKKVRGVIAVRGGRTASTAVRSGLKRPPGRPPGNKPISAKISKKKLMRAGLRSGGSIQEPKPAQKPSAKLKKQEEANKAAVTVAAQRGATATPTSAPAVAKVLRHKKSRAEREIGSDFSSDDNEPLLTPKPPQRPLTRGRGSLPKRQATNVEGRPVRRTKTAAAAYMEVLTRKLVCPTGDDEQSFEDFPEPPQSRRLEKRECLAKELASTSKKPLTEGKPSPKVSPTRKIPARATEIGRPKKKLKKDIIRPSTRSQVTQTTVPIKKPAVRSLIQKKKLNSLRTLTRLSNSKRLSNARKVLKPAEVKKIATVIAEKSISEPASDEAKRGKGPEISTRTLRGKNPETTAATVKVPLATTTKKQKILKEIKADVAEKTAKKVKHIEVGLGGLAKRPVRKCSNIDKIWIDIDGFTSDEDDFIDVDSMADAKASSSKKEEKEEPLIQAKGKSRAKAALVPAKKLEAKLTAAIGVSSSGKNNDEKISVKPSVASAVTPKVKDKLIPSTLASAKTPSTGVALKGKEEKLPVVSSSSKDEGGKSPVKTKKITEVVEKEIEVKVVSKTSGEKIIADVNKEVATQDNIVSSSSAVRRKGIEANVKPGKSINPVASTSSLGKLQKDKTTKSSEGAEKVTVSVSSSSSIAKNCVSASIASVNTPAFVKEAPSTRSVSSTDYKVAGGKTRTKSNSTCAQKNDGSTPDCKADTNMLRKSTSNSVCVTTPSLSSATSAVVQKADSLALPATKVILVPSVGVKADVASSTSVESGEKDSTLCRFIPSAPGPSVASAGAGNLPSLIKSAASITITSPTSSTCSSFPVTEKPVPMSPLMPPAADTKTEDSHALIARLAATVSMTAQPAVSKAITKDLKPVTTCVHSDHIKKESLLLKSEPPFKSEESKMCLGFEDKKDIVTMCNRSSSMSDTKPFFKDNFSKLQLPKSDLVSKLEPNKPPVKKLESIKITEVQRLNCDVTSSTEKQGQAYKFTASGLGQLNKQASEMEKISLEKVSETKTVPPKAHIPDTSTKPKEMKFVTGKEEISSSSGNISKAASKQPTKDMKAGSSGAEENKVNPKDLKVHDKITIDNEKKTVNVRKDEKSPANVGGAGRRRRTTQSMQSQSVETERRERPKRQCSNIGKSWIERDSDDSSFYQSGDEDFLELIRQSELAERRKKERAQRRSWKSSSREEKEGEDFSDSDDEPLKKKSTSSASVASASTQETSRLSQPSEELIRIPKNSPGKSEAPQERDNRAGASGLAEAPPSAVTFVPPPMREPINTHGLDLLSEVVTYGNFGRDSGPEKSTARIEQWLNENLRADSSKAFLGFDESEIQRPAMPVHGVPSYSTSDPVLQFIRVPSETQKPQQEPENQTKKSSLKIPEPTSSFKRKPVASVQELLKLQKERRETPKPPPEQHSKNCQCNSCVVKKAWFKNKPVPDDFKPPSREASPAKPFQFLTSVFTGPNGKSSSDTSTGKASASIAPMVLNKDIKTVGTQRKLSFLERMRERERKEAMMKPSASAFSPNNESSVYAFEPEPPERQSGPKVVPFRSRSVSSRSTHTTNDDSEEEKNRHQSTSIAVQTNFEDMETQTSEVAPTVTEDGKSNEISTQTDGGDDDPNSGMFYIPIEPCTSQDHVQGVTLKLDAEGPMGPNRRVVMKAKLVRKTTPNLKAVVMPLQKFDNQKNAPPIGTVQPTSRRPPVAAAATATSPPAAREDGKRVSPRRLVESEEIPLSRLKTKKDRQSSPVAKPSPSRSSPSPSKPSTSPSKQSPAPPPSAEEPAKVSPGSPAPKASSSVSSDTTNAIKGVVEAPTFHLTEKEFQDPLEFFERIRPAAERFGLCRIVPPSSFKPDCKVADDMRFTAYNQFVHRMLHRWGPSARETMAMKKYLKTQSISLKPPPCVGGMEVDLPRLYKAVQTSGGLMKVMEKQKWQHVADMMRIPKAAHDRATKLDSIYCQYLLPYDTLTSEEREKLLNEVDADWSAYEEKIGEEVAEDEDEDEEENYIEECEECIVKGRNMPLSQFYRIARNTMSMWFKSPEPSPSEVEEEFWRHVTERSNHVCVHSGSIDSSGWGYGFPVGKNNFAKHPWNLKVLTNNHGSVLRSLGPVMGVTVPTLHVGMVFAAFCWYRDPHGLPWIEYLHTGAPKIWYGISDDNSEHLREALTKLLPRHIRNQRIWLPCDTAMAPPDKLAELGVPLCRTTQEPGQFVLVFPRAFTSSLCTGYLVSESVYFALPSWLQTAEQAFRDIHDSAESSAFSLDNLLFSIAGDSRASVDILRQVLPMVQKVRDRELEHRKALEVLGVKSEMLPRETNRKRGRTAEPETQHECDVCRASLFLSLVSISAEESVFCLKHGLQQLTEHPDQLTGAKHLYLFDQDEVNQVYTKLEERIGAKLQKSSKK